MKEASGELNMTVITIVAIAGIAAFFALVIWPNVRNSVNDEWSGVTANRWNK
jgi:hypothetical protein